MFDWLFYAGGSLLIALAVLVVVVSLLMPTSRRRQRANAELQSVSLKVVEAWDKPFVRGRHMRPEDIGMRFEDVYYDRFGIAVAIYESITDHTSSRGANHEWLVVDALGHTTNITNCHVEEPAGKNDRPYYGHRG